ncbi:MAG: OmpA family protein [Prevotellaceae bacterium]|jgi:chemotaxis protein MotB|nr:OmpA family protein [Prevotellaceae bacterium]
MIKNRLVLFLTAGIILSSSCVSTQKYESLEVDYLSVSRDRDILNARLNELNTERARLAARTRSLEMNMQDVQSLKEENESLQKQLGELRDMFNRTSAARVSESSGMTRQIQRDQEELQRREDELKTRKAELERMQTEMEERNRRLIELEGILARKDSVVAALRAKVSDALLGFADKGLTVTQKNGKVYVSMDEKLLFKSGSYDIDPQGAAAIKELGNVLRANADINVMIEGHTDDVPYRGKGDLKDNWDLSVKRATTVVRVLLQSGIDGKRVIASGHAEFAPLSTGKAPVVRQKNRRTEIILTPKLDELFSILESN